MNIQLTQDLVKAISSKAMRLGMDYTDVRYDISPVEAQAVLLAGAQTLIKMAAGLQAGMQGETDPQKALHNSECYYMMLGLLVASQEKVEALNATRS